MIDDKPPQLLDILFPTTFVTTDYGNVPGSSLGIKVVTDKDLTGLSSGYLNLKSLDGLRRVTIFLNPEPYETTAESYIYSATSTADSLMSAWGDVALKVDYIYLTDGAKNQSTYFAPSWGSVGTGVLSQKILEKTIDVSSVAFPTVHMPKIDIKASKTSISEKLNNTVVNFLISTVNLDPSKLITYALEGIDVADLDRVRIGNVVQDRSGTGVNKLKTTGSLQLNSDGTTYIEVYTYADNRTEGVETLRLRINDTLSAPVTIIDDSINPSATISAEKAVVDEGGEIKILIRGSGFDNGMGFTPKITGVTSDDFLSGASLTGDVFLWNNPFTLTYFTAQDQKTEGVETFTFSIPELNISTSVQINDTSKSAGASTSVTSPAVSVGNTSTSNVGASTTTTSNLTQFASSVITRSYDFQSTQVTVKSPQKNGIWEVSTPSGKDFVTGTNRIVFPDKSIALDFSKGQPSYNTATLIGAAFGKQYIAEYFSVGVHLFDKGNSLKTMCELIVNTGLIENMSGGTTKGWVDHVYMNAIGTKPDALTNAIFTTYLERGTYTKAGLLEMASQVASLESRIDLVGLQTDGIAYTPFAFG
jgi:hypothetical protein